MASFLARALTLAIPGTDYFTDDQGSVHEGPANALRESEISFGCSESKFCSNAPTTREQMASFLFRALDLPPATSDYFSDDAGSVHENDINALRQSGITTGCTSVQYCPTRSITREQMAAFLYRALNG